MNAFWIEQVEAYLEGKITRSDLQAIAEQEGIQDVEQEINWLRDSRLAIEATGLKEQLEEALPKVEKEKSKVRGLRVLRPIMAIAAALLVLVIAFIAINRDAKPALYAEFEYVAPGLPVLMSQSEEHLFYDAMTYYSEENYEIASEKLSGLLEASPSNDTIAYYLGASQLYLDNISEAIAALNKVVTDPESEFRQNAQWLQVLCALRLDNNVDAEKNLAPILTDPEHPFFNQASQLQQKLSQINQ